MHWDFENGDVNGLFKFIIAGIALLGLQSGGGFFMCSSSFFAPSVRWFRARLFGDFTLR